MKRASVPCGSRPSGECSKFSWTLAEAVIVSGGSTLREGDVAEHAVPDNRVLSTDCFMEAEFFRGLDYAREPGLEEEFVYVSKGAPVLIGDLEEEEYVCEDR